MPFACLFTMEERLIVRSFDVAQIRTVVLNAVDSFATDKAPQYKSWEIWSIDPPADG